MISGIVNSLTLGVRVWPSSIRHSEFWRKEAYGRSLKPSLTSAPTGQSFRNYYFHRKRLITPIAGLPPQAQGIGSVATAIDQLLYFNSEDDIQIGGEQATNAQILLLRGGRLRRNSCGIICISCFLIRHDSDLTNSDPTNEIQDEPPLSLVFEKWCIMRWVDWDRLLFFKLLEWVQCLVLRECWSLSHFLFLLILIFNHSPCSGLIPLLLPCRLLSFDVFRWISSV